MHGILRLHENHSFCKHGMRLHEIHCIHDIKRLHENHSLCINSIKRLHENHSLCIHVIKWLHENHSLCINSIKRLQENHSLCIHGSKRTCIPCNRLPQAEWKPFLWILHVSLRELTLSGYLRQTSRQLRGELSNKPSLYIYNLSNGKTEGQLI